MCIELRVERRNLRARRKRNQPRWYAVECSGLVCRMLRIGQQHAGSRGIGKPSRVPRVGNTWSSCWLSLLTELCWPDMRPSVEIEK